MSKIFKVNARQIFDSRGNPTVEVDVITESGSIGRAAVPSGASTGEHEAVELRDGGKKYMGKGVLSAIKNIHEIISPALIGCSVFDQKNIDKKMIELDGTSNKSKLGANSILGVSLACAKSASIEKSISLFKYLGSKKSNILPVPMMNIINGGSHSDAPISFQEFMIVPTNAKTFSHALQIGSEIFHNLKKILKSRNLSTSVGDEGGFAPKLSGTEDALETIIDAIRIAGYKPGDDVKIALDSGKIFDSKGQAEFLKNLVEKYPIISIEDGMDENDWEGWKYLTKIVGDKVQLVGDDLFVTNVERLQKGIKDNIANSILIKVNQIGTLSETIDAVEMAQRAGYTCVMSHRSGETEDNTIADLAVALRTGQIKTGSLSRSDRMSKYNQLLRIEEELGDKATYPGDKVFKFAL